MTRPDRNDRGGATIFLVLAMAAILIGAGLAIDVGQYVVHARSAQNSADATALAVATDCANNGAPIADYSPYRKPGQTINAPACGSGETTITATKTVGGLLLKQTAGDVDRSATARWGALGAANTVPLTIADCELADALADDFETPTYVILYTDTPPPGGCSSPAGGFGGLNTPPGPNDDTCKSPTIAGDLVDGQPGAAVLHKVISCFTPLPREILIPVYDSGACEASNCKLSGNGEYKLVGYAMLEVDGYWFGNNQKYRAGTLNAGCPNTVGPGQQYCIGGQFIKFVTSNGAPCTSGDCTYFGAYQVYLSD